MPRDKPHRRGNRVRIIGGAWRSRQIRFPDVSGLRPTPDRVRETLFNWLGQELGGMHCLDLYAGSGALGFEAASRGAAWVTMVERDARAFRALCENKALLGAQLVELERTDALEFLARPGRRFDLAFLDPPFGEGVPELLWPRLLGRLATGATVYLEGATAFAGRPQFALLKQGRAGAVHFHLLKRTGNDQGGISGVV